MQFTLLRNIFSRNIFQVGVDDKGKIEYLKAKFIQDSGCNLNDSPLQSAVQHFNNCYESSKFKVESQQIRTDTASNTWCRAPGTTEGVAFIEEIMEHIAAETKQDPLAVRLANLHTKDNEIPSMVADLKTSADYENRKTKVKQFNEVKTQFRQKLETGKNLSLRLR
jgi:xanthine dehydrogenase/oxidase